MRCIQRNSKKKRILNVTCYEVFIMKNRFRKYNQILFNLLCLSLVGSQSTKSNYCYRKKLHSQRYTSWKVLLFKAVRKIKLKTIFSKIDLYTNNAVDYAQFVNKIFLARYQFICRYYNKPITILKVVDVCSLLTDKIKPDTSYSQFEGIFFLTCL